MHTQMHTYMNMGMPNCSLLLIEYDTQFICRKKDEQKLWSEFLMKMKTFAENSHLIYQRYDIVRACGLAGWIGLQSN